jgi:glutathione synthase/RimK-type ligase-like ATP-grasp enzyme
MKAVLFKSNERFQAFKKKLENSKIEVIVLDFEKHDWLNFDYNQADILIYYPSFRYSSNHPLALKEVHDNISFLAEFWPHLKIYPDPGIIKYYNDKYRQFLFLNEKEYPIPETIPLLSSKSVELADKKLGYPMVVKNRYGAGGGSVFRIFNKKELQTYYKLSTLNFFNKGAAKFFGNLVRRKIFYYNLIKVKKIAYPFLSAPLLAQKFIKIDRDLKTVAGNYKVVESHWRHQANEAMWKVNIDDGGIGVWSKIPQEAIDLSVSLAKDLKASWINLDLIRSNGNFMITEFSPVWHHYAYKEKPTFVYKDDYNIDIPLEISLDLEGIIVESLFQAANNSR